MKIVVFGSGHFGKQALREYGADRVDYFVDNNYEKWSGKGYQGKQVISFEEYRKIADGYHTVVAVDNFYSIKKQLCDSGITEFEIYNPFYNKQFNIIKSRIQNVSGNILLCGIDEKTEIIWRLLRKTGVSKNKIFFADMDDNLKNVSSFQGLKIHRIEECVMQVDLVIVSAEDRAYALQACLERNIKSDQIINMFIPTGFGKKDCLFVNPYEGVGHDITEQEWITQNDDEKVQFSINNYIEELAVDLPLFQHIEIETYNRCNGVCNFCPVSVKNEKRPLMKMDESLFRRIIDQLEEMDYRGGLATFSNNEPFLDDRLVSFNRYARGKLPNVHMHLFTNGTVLRLECFIEIMKYLDEIVIDNYNQELKLIPSVKKIVEYCEEHPELIERVTVVMRKPIEVRTSRGGDAPNRKKTDYMASFGCVLPFRQMIVRPDGKVSLCCNDAYGKNTMGDLSKESIKDVWYGEKFRKVREAMQKGRGNYGECRYCDTAMLL